MRNLQLVAILTATLLIRATVDAQQASFALVPGVSSVTDVTPDGQVLVGSGGGGAWIWKWKVDPAPTFIGGRGAAAVSDDGTVVAGDMDDPISGAQVAGRWTLATGMVELQNLGNGQNRASVISRDGSLIGGFAQGSFNRTPALWYPDGTGMVYDMDVVGEVFGLSDEGTTVLGSWNGEAFRQDNAGPILTFGVDNPNGMHTPGSVPVVLTSLAPAATYPCGIQVQYWGMGAVSGHGELLVDTFTPGALILPALVGSPWTGPGVPAPVPFQIPNKPNLVGLSLYCQGVLIDPLGPMGIGLGRALEIAIGGI